MRKLILSVAVATATLAAVPAAAQYHQGHHRGNHDGWSQRGPNRHAVGQLLAQIDRAEQRILRSERRGAISHREAFGLRREANRLRHRLHRASRNGLSGREFGELRMQVHGLQQRVRLERRDRDGRRG